MFLGPLGGRERKIPVVPLSLGILGLVLLKMSTGLTLDDGRLASWLMSI